jgi:hypothetical protein
MKHTYYRLVKDGKKLAFPRVPDDVLTAVVDVYVAAGYTFEREVLDFDNLERSTYVGGNIRPDEGYDE